ncbi:MAG TPA: TlpA disulfide reductase family protein [Pyrinomonadaceae bacterium]|jgi:thiol-disulfide isomerase/thioredoxin
MRRLLLAIMVLTLLPAAARAQEGRPTGAAPPAPEGDGFRLKGLDGKFHDTASMRGEVLVVSFGATWCVPCAWELVAIEELKEEYAGKPVRFLWVSIEDTKRVTNNILKYYVKDRKLSLTVLRDPGGVALARYERTGTRIPVLVFFDAEGRLAAPVHQGMTQEIALYKKMVRERVDALLARPPAKAEAGGR